MASRHRSLSQELASAEGVRGSDLQNARVPIKFFYLDEARRIHVGPGELSMGGGLENLLNKATAVFGLASGSVTAAAAGTPLNSDLDLLHAALGRGSGPLRLHLSAAPVRHEAQPVAPADWVLLEESAEHGAVGDVASDLSGDYGADARYRRDFIDADAEDLLDAELVDMQAPSQAHQEPLLQYRPQADKQDFQRDEHVHEYQDERQHHDHDHDHDHDHHDHDHDHTHTSEGEEVEPADPSVHLPQLLRQLSQEFRGGIRSTSEREEIKEMLLSGEEGQIVEGARMLSISENAFLQQLPGGDYTSLSSGPATVTSTHQATGYVSRGGVGAGGAYMTRGAAKPYTQSRGQGYMTTSSSRSSYSTQF